MPRKRLGLVVDGAFNAGLTVRLDAGVSMEDLRIGSFVTIEGSEHVFFSMISDMQLRTTDERLLSTPPSGASPFVARILAGTGTYGALEVKPMLMMPTTSLVDPSAALVGAGEELGVETVRTIPMHYAVLCEAGELDFATVFGAEGTGKFFAMGTPLTMDIPVCIDLAKLMERSTGVFGQTGTGKSFLARILLAGLIKLDVGVNLIFDMHDEYSFGKRAEDKTWAKGLKHLFGGQISVYSLDEEATRKQGRSVDAVLTVGLNQIEPNDLLLLGDQLKLSETAVISAHLLKKRFDANWLVELLQQNETSLDDFANSIGAHPASIGALWRAAQRLRRPYVTDRAEFGTIDKMVEHLDRGKHVILQFGRYNSLLDYLLVSNTVTKRVRELYRKKVEQFESSRDAKDEPRPLMITIEEAHKFLNPDLASQTIFGEIAREMRKYYVTLMIVDQRPSGIDSEILSQIGTKVSGRLTDERDIEAVLTGVADRSALKGALASLNTKQEVLIMGHAVPMPIQIRTRKYDEQFYKDMGAREAPGMTNEEREKKLDEIGL